MPDEPDILDYRNPNTGTPHPLPAAESPLASKPAKVVPAEFERLLTQSIDHGAVAAIETALRAAKIASFRTDDGRPVKREFRLFVGGGDFERASLVASQIFARRARIKALPAIEVPPDATGLMSNPLDPLPRIERDLDALGL